MLEVFSTGGLESQCSNGARKSVALDAGPTPLAQVRLGVRDYIQAEDADDAVDAGPGPGRGGRLRLRARLSLVARLPLLPVPSAPSSGWLPSLRSRRARWTILPKLDKFPPSLPLA
eukprot:1888964-Alexandrium_andersonii.AAC.1